MQIDTLMQIDTFMQAIINRFFMRDANVFVAIGGYNRVELSSCIFYFYDS
jgi:hypothetical protein